MSDRIEIIDVAPRDGLQSQARILDTESKLELIRRLINAGVRRIEVASFVNPKRVPQMADADEVIKGLPRMDGVKYIGLVLNMRGFERALASGIDEVNSVVVATDTFSLRNQGMSTEESMAMAQTIIAQSGPGLPFRGVTISAAFGCPFEGEVLQGRVVEIAARLADMGYEEIALADTIGVAGPSDVSRMIDAVTRVTGNARLRCHFHNTRNTGVANAYAAIQSGVKILDASCGGVGGCPFAPAATGNIATEDVLYMLNRIPVATGIEIAKIMETAKWLGERLGVELPAMVTRAGLFPSACTGV